MGEVFAGRYELADPIGRGGVGAVWRAWDHRRRRYVAAKVLLQSDAHSLLRFVREQALRIDHPHVLAPASWAADDDKVLFTMDLVSGGSLVHLIGDYGPLPPSFVCTLLDQLLAGLAAVHAEDVVHRDIKPANILLEATGTGRPRLRLSDFGIAMRLGEPRLTETNLVVGTPGYLAPEQMMGAEPDFPADLFAVGLVALYLLEGAKPDAKALIQYFAAHGTPSAPQSVPDPLWQVVASLLQPDPQARFRTATGARKALAAARELLPEPGPEDESIEIFDQLGPLPPGFGPEGPLKQAPGVDPRRTHHGGTGAEGGARFRAGDGGAGAVGGAGSVGGEATPASGGPSENWAAPGAGAPYGSGLSSGGAGAPWSGRPPESRPPSAGEPRSGGGAPSEGAGALGSRGPSESWSPSAGDSPSRGGVPSGRGKPPENWAPSGSDSHSDGARGSGGTPENWPSSEGVVGLGNEGSLKGWAPSGSGATSGSGAPSKGEGVPGVGVPPENWAAPGGRADSGGGRQNGVYSGGDGGSAGAFGAGGGEGAAAWPGYGAGAGADSGGAVDGAASWPSHPHGSASRPGESDRAASWFGEANGVSPQPPGAAGGASSWPGNGHGPASFRPDGTGGAASRSAARGDASWHEEGQANPGSWPEQSTPPSWPGETNTPPPPGAVPSTPGANTPAAPPSSHAEAGHPQTGVPSPTHEPGTGTGAYWSAPHTPPAPAGPPSTSEPGSFPLPPPFHPQPQEHRHQPRPQAQAHSAYAFPHDPTPPTHVLPSPQHQPRADASTASYTAQTPQVPPPARAISRARRSGPPAKVAVPLLLLALACYAVGFWALTQI